MAYTRNIVSSTTSYTASFFFFKCKLVCSRNYKMGCVGKKIYSSWWSF